MALSAEERRQWRELERQLATEAPTLVQPAEDLTSGHPTEDRGITRRTIGIAGAILAVVVVLVAFVVVIFAVIIKILLISVLGFILMLCGGTRFRSFRGMKQPVRDPIRPSGDAS